MKNTKNRLKIVSNLSTATWAMVIGGIAIVAIAKIPLGTWDTNGFVIFVKQMFDLVGTTLFSAGAVSIVVEISTISQIVEKGIQKILAGTFPFENFSKDRLEEVHKQIAELRLNDERLETRDIEASPYVLEPELLELSKGLYYEYHKAKFIITPDSSRGVFKKRVEFDYKIINKLGLDNKVKITISLICKKDNLSKEDVKKSFDVKAFTIEESNKIKVAGKHKNEINLTAKANDYWQISEVKQQEHSLYMYNICFEYQLSDKVANRVVLIYEYEIPQSDITQSYKLNYPSKVLEHEITICGEGWEVTGDAYTAFYFPELYEDRQYTVARTVPTTIRADFRDWAVPGAGYMVTFLKS